jgi:hypothetical protein
MKDWEKRALVKYCIEKYESAFDLNVAPKGNRSADLIAWAEVMHVLQPK